MAKGKRRKNKKKSPKPAARSAEVEPPTGGPAPRLNRPRVTPKQALIAIATVGACTGLFAVMPIDIVEGTGGRALFGLIAGGLGAASALLWGLDLVALRKTDTGETRILMSSLLFPPLLAAGLMLMHDVRAVAIPALALGATMLVYLALNEIGRDGEPMPPTEKESE